MTFAQSYKLVTRQTETLTHSGKDNIKGFNNQSNVQKMQWIQFSLRTVTEIPLSLALDFPIRISTSFIYAVAFIIAQ